MSKKIEIVTKKASELKTGFGNPRKITRKKLEELKESMQELGDFGVFIIDEDDNVIGGNQRLKAVLAIDPESEVLCKRLIGYTKAEKRAINIKDNTHSGEWDLEMMADWTADLNLDLGLELNNSNPDDRKIEDMELIRYERYNYVMIVCRSEIDYNDLIRKLGIDGKKVAVTKKRKIKARAIWYDQMKGQIVEPSAE